MKSEMRKITVEQEVFIAFDGTEFTDKDDCTDYETGLRLQRFQMLDYDFRPCDSIDDCHFVNIKTADEANEFIDLCNLEGFSSEGIDEPGVYMYTYGNYGRRSRDWTNLSEIIKKFDEREDNTSGN